MLIIFFLYAACELSQVSAFAEEMKQYGLVTCSVQQTAQTVGLHYSKRMKRNTWHTEGTSALDSARKDESHGLWPNPLRSNSLELRVHESIPKSTKLSQNC